MKISNLNKNVPYPGFVDRKKAFLALIKYLISKSPDMFREIKKQIELMRVLKPYKNSNLISYRTYAIYLFSYISKTLTVEDKLQILTFNYHFLKNILSFQKLNLLFTTGIECYNEFNEKDQYSVILTNSSLLEFEGSLSLFFKVNDIKVFTLSFTFCPGKVFGLTDEPVIYISCLQGVKNQFDNISKATKFFHDIIPSVILIKVLEAIAASLSIKTILGISARDQLSFEDEATFENFYENYDQFWQNIGGQKTNSGHYLISCPLHEKPIILIKQNHRNRAIKKRTKLKEIYTFCCKNILNIIILPFLDNITCSITSHLNIEEFSSM